MKTEQNTAIELTEKQAIYVNDNRFTTGENKVKATFGKLSADGSKMQVRIKGKFAWLPTENFIELASDDWRDDVKANSKKSSSLDLVDEAAIPSSKKAPKSVAAEVAKSKGKKVVAQESNDPATEIKAEQAEKAAEKALKAPTKTKTSEKKESAAEPKKTSEKAKVSKAHKATADGESVIEYLQKNLSIENADFSDLTLNDIAEGVGKVIDKVETAVNTLSDLKLVSIKNEYPNTLVSLTEAGWNYKTGEPRKVASVEKEVKKATTTAAAAKKEKTAKEPTKKEKVLALLAEGKTHKEAAEAASCNVAWVHLIEKFAAYEKILAAGKKVLATDVKEGSKKEQVIKLYDAGKKTSEIAKELNADPTYVYELRFFTFDAKKA